MWNSHYLDEPCGVCGSEKCVERHTTEKQNMSYVPLAECLEMEKNIIGYRLSEELASRFIKKNMCANCRTSLAAFSKSAIDKINDVTSDDELDIVSLEWVTKRLKSVSSAKRR